MFDLGRSTYEQDANRIRPLVMERRRLTRDVAAAATTVYINNLPRNVSAYGGWVVIDPWTNECEVRKITGRTGKALTIGALAYSHSKYDEVLFMDSPVVNTQWTGALGDGTTNDYLGLYRGFVQAGTINGSVYTPNSTYVIGSGLSWPNGMVAWVGDRHTIIKATAAITMLDMSPDNTGYNARYLEVRNLLLDGNGAATAGLVSQTVIECNFKNITIEDVHGAGLILSNTQNSNFDRVFSVECYTGIQVSNGAASNAFFGCHTNQSVDYGLRFVEDTSIDNYTGTVTASNQNAFFKCIFERGSADLYQCHIKNGSRNTFVGCSFNGPVSRTVPVVYTDSTQAGQNLWEHCRFNAGTVSAYSIVYNNGDYNRFRDCMFTDWSGTADVILTTSPVFISRCYIEDAQGTIRVQTGLVADNVVYEPYRQAGGTADYPSVGDAYITDYYDTDTKKPMWYSPVSASWHDAVNGRFTLGARTNATISGGTVTIDNRSNYAIDTLGGTAAAGTVLTITGGETGQVLALRAVANTRTVVLQDGTGNLQLAGDFSLDHSNDRIVLQFDGTNWCEWSRSDNSA